MARTKVYQVKDNRIRFKCDTCGTKRSLAIPPRVRTRSVRCHRCGAHVRVGLNRRQERREQQSGKATMILTSGREMGVDLQDISFGGVGVQTVPGGGRLISPREEVSIKCSWNQKLFSHGRYFVRSVRGDRIGIQVQRRVTWG